MTFVGIISDNKSFQVLKENIGTQDVNLIQINNKSIDNIKNIKFEMIIINKELKSLEEKKLIIDTLCMNSKYILLNTDLNKEFNFGQKCKEKIITFGLNHRATVTVSSITESNILVYLQRNVKDKNDKLIEVGEKQVKINKDNKIKVYEILIIYIFLILNNEPIILKTSEKSNFFE